MKRRRQFLAALAGGVGVLAGCSESTDTETSGQPTDDDPSSNPSTNSTDRNTTVRPVEGMSELVEVTDRVEKEGESVPVHTPSADTGLGAALQRYTYETYSSFQNQNVWNTNRRVHVGLGPKASVQNVTAAYETGYYPPSEPFEPVYTDGLITGTETSDGIAFDLPMSGEIQDVFFPFDMVESSDGYRDEGDGKLVVPYDNLTPDYLARPLYKTRVTTTRTNEQFLLQVPHPEVSMTVQQVTTNETEDDGLLLERIAADVTIDSKKPTQYVNLHTNFGTTESYDYGTTVEADNFTAIDGQGTTRVERDFTETLNSIDQYNFREFYPIDRLNFDVVLGQIAPLASEAVSADRFIP